MCLRVCVCMYNVCSCANSSAISQAQILKLCSEETTIKGETPTIPFLWFFFPLFSLLLIFLILHLFFSGPPHFSSSLSFLHWPILFLSFSVALPSSPSLSAPAFKHPPSPPWTPWQQPREGARRSQRQWEIDRRCLRRSHGSCTGGSDIEQMAGLIWPAHCSPLTRAASQYHPCRLTPQHHQWPEKPTHTIQWNCFLMRGTPPDVCVSVSHSHLNFLGCFCVYLRAGVLVINMDSCFMFR